LFGIPAAAPVDVPKGTAFMETVVSMSISQIRDFANHPFRVRNDDITQEIVRDIRNTGRIETPAIVRPVEGGYEMISGHRRKLACSLAGLDAMPVIVREMTDDEATIAMVSANRQREQVLPSEKAHAYKMWLDALNRQGQRTDLTCATLLHKSDGTKSREVIAQQEGISHEQVRKFIRLNELIPELLEMVDNDAAKAKDKPTMAFSVAVEISTLSADSQRDLLLTMQSEERTPSISQAMLMKQKTAEGSLNMDAIFQIMQQDKPNQKDQIKLPRERNQQILPRRYAGAED